MEAPKLYRHFEARDREGELCGHEHNTLEDAFVCRGKTHDSWGEVAVIDLYGHPLTLYQAYKYGFLDLEPVVTREDGTQ